MKNKKLKGLLVTAGLALVSSGMLIGHLSTGRIGESIHEAVAAPIEDHGNWYAFRADDTEDVYALDLKLSPLPGDYRGISKDSATELLNDLMEGIKSIAAAQIKFVQPVEEPERKDEDLDLKPDEPIRKDVLDALIIGVLGDGEGGTNQEHLDDYDSTMIVKEQGLDGSAGLFLRDMMAYMSAFGQDGSTDENLISVRLGVDVDEHGTVTPTAQSSVYQTLVELYEAAEDPQAEEKAKLGLQKAYDDAKEIAENPVVKTQSLVKIFDALEETTVPVKTVVNIIGAQNTLDGVKSIFTDKNVGVQYGTHFLNELTTRTVADICDSIQSELHDPVTNTGGFTKDDIIEAFEEASNTRLMEIFDGLNAHGIENIRVILGKPVDYDEGGYIPEQFRKAPVKVKAPVFAAAANDGAASMSDYAKFGEKLMEIVMSRLSPKDLLTAAKSIEIVYEGVNYMIAEKPEVEGGSDNLQFRVHNIVDLLNALPKMEDVRDMADGEMVLDFKVNLITVLNDKVDITDPSTGAIIGEEYTPITYNCSLGFQNKDSKYIRKLAALLDDTFDLTFDFDDAQDLSFDLKTRNPNFVSNIYAWLCDSGFIENENVDKFLNEIWDIAFSSIDDIKNYIQGKEIEDVVRNLQELDYEKALDLVTTADELNEIFGVLGFTDARLETALSKFVKLLEKASTVTFDTIVDYVAKVSEGVANKIDDSVLEKIYNKLLSIVKRVLNKGISIEKLQDITNEGIYEYVERITGREDLFLRFRNKLVSLINRLPQSIRDKSLMDAYVGNGRFKASKKYAVDWEKWIKKIPSYGSKAWVAFDSMIVGDDRPATISVSLDSTFNDIYSVTYEWSEDGSTVSKTGMLHVDSDVMLFGGIEEDDGGTIAHWIDKNAASFTRVDQMVDYDVTLIPEHLFNVEISEAISKVYDGTGSLTVTPSSEWDSVYTYTYQWQKLGADGETWEDVTGETEATISVPNVLDSGTYRCVVNNGDVDVASASRDVAITPATIDISVATWDKEGPFNYSGELITVSIDSTSIPAGASVSNYTGNYSESEKGTYTATAVFALDDPDNYCFKDGVSTLDLDWEIKEGVIDDFTATWLEDDEFEFDGTAKCPEIDPTSYPADKVTVTYETKLATAEDTDYAAGGQINPGEYVVKAVFTPIDPGYEISDDCLPETMEFTVYKVIDLTELTWSHHDTFEYDGQSHSVSVKNYEDISEIASITYVTTAEDESTTDTNSATDVGNYSTVATINRAEGYNENTIRFINDNVSGDNNAISWSIKKALIKVTAIEWDYEDPFTFDEGVPHTVSVKTTSLPAHVTFSPVTEEGVVNTATNAGTYTAKVEIMIDPTDPEADNYGLTADSVTEYTLTWKINPKVINLDSVVWGTTTSYTGSEQTVEITSATNLEYANVTYEGNKATDAGNYLVTATITSNDTNYVFGDPTLSHAYAINKKDISVGTVTWTATKTYTYDGNEHTIEVTNYGNDSLVDVKYVTAKGGTDAGEYLVRAEFALKDTAKANYNLIGETSSTATVTINPAQISSSDIVTWSNETITYDGNKHSVTATINPDYVDIVDFGYIHNATKTHEATNAGNYTAQIVCIINEENAGNYVIIDDTAFTHDWSIEKASVKVENITWPSVEGIVYDGTAHVVDPTFTVDGAPTDLVVAHVSDGTKTNAGDYLAEVTFELLDTDNYEFADEYTSQQEWSIKKATINVDSITWDYNETPYVYSGSAYNVNITNVLPEQVEVTYSGDRDVVDADEYSTTATLSIKAEFADNYEFAEGAITESSIDWEIAKKHVTPGTIVWSENSFVYDGTNKTVSITSFENSDVIDVTLKNNVNKDAGEYEAAAKFALKTGFNDNYVLDVTEAYKKYSIAKKQIVVSNITWTNGELTYTGSEQSITVSYAETSLVNVAVIGNKATNAGYYTATAMFTEKDSKNYEIIGTKTSVQNWVINKAKITISGAVWSDTSTPLTYNGSTQTVTLTNFANSTLVDVSYSGNSAKNAGKYTAVAMFTLKDKANYELTNDVITHDYTIAKAKISVGSVTWDYVSPFTEDGNVKEVKVTSCTNSQYVDVMYVSGNTGRTAGNYIAVADFALKPQYVDNYELVSTPVASLNWKIVKPEVTIYYDFTSYGDMDEDSNYNAMIHIEEGVTDDLDLIAKLSEGKEFEGIDIDFKDLIGGKGEVKYSYDINFMKDGRTFVIGENTYTIKVLIPEDLRDAEFTVIVLDQNGEVKTVEKEVSEDGKYVVIHDDSVKNVGFVTPIPHTTSLADNPQFIAIICIVAAAQLAIVLATVLVSKKIKKNRDAE